MFPILGEAFGSKKGGFPTEIVNDMWIIGGVVIAERVVGVKGEVGEATFFSNNGRGHRLDVFEEFNFSPHFDFWRFCSEPNFLTKLG